MNVVDLDGRQTRAMDGGGGGFLSLAGVIAIAGLAAYLEKVHRKLAQSTAHASSSAYHHAVGAARHVWHWAHHIWQAQHGKNNVEHSHHIGVSDETLKDLLVDPLTDAAEKAKIRQTLKARKQRRSRQNRE